MSQTTDAMTATGPQPDGAPLADAQPGGWKLVADAPPSDMPHPRDRRGAARGMVLLLVGGGFFWLAVGAAIFLATR